MKHITYTKYLGFDFDFDITDPNNDRDALAIASMPELRTLQLFRDKLTNAGLASIIDNCPHLESLDLTGCRNITMDDALRAMCSRIKKKTILPSFKDHHASAINYRPIRTLGSIYWRDIADAAAKYIAGDDSVPKESRYSYCYYLGEDDEINLEYYDRILDKSMRRYKM
jgi:hypothetical protein